MSEHNDYFDTVIAESLSIFDSDRPEPPDSWVLDDFEDIVPVDVR